ncbi:MAG: hypothetical protein U0L97_02440 [Candidatus Saccharimonadaceae bacterium]|nr:hypothetical protein [Candidatus Saccharimonadaceae bacterium]
MLILSHYIRFATKNSAKQMNRHTNPTVHRFITPKEYVISSMMGAKANTAEYK